MKRRTVLISNRANRDVRAISAWISRQGAPVTAQRYAGRIRRFLKGLALASERGTLRDDVLVRLRIVGFESSATIAFRVYPEVVVVLRVFSNGQDWEGALRGDADHRAEEE